MKVSTELPVTKRCPTDAKTLSCFKINMIFALNPTNINISIVRMKN